jgi:hypothetical protein
MAGNMSALTCMRVRTVIDKFVVSSVVMLDVYSGGLSEEGK